MPTLSSLVALELVIMEFSQATSDDKVGIMTTLVFKYSLISHTFPISHTIA